jgi:hypothetical protein
MTLTPSRTTSRTPSKYSKVGPDTSRHVHALVRRISGTRTLVYNDLCMDSWCGVLYGTTCLREWLNVDARIHCRSGIRYRQEFSDFGIKSHLCGWPDLTEADYKAEIPRQTLRFMGDNASKSATVCNLLCALCERLGKVPRTARAEAEGLLLADSHSWSCHPFAVGCMRARHELRAWSTYMSSQYVCIPVCVCPQKCACLLAPTWS